MDRAPPHLTMSRPTPDALLLQLAGTWRVGEAIPPVAGVGHELETERPAHVAFDTRELAAWDSTLVAFVERVVAIAHSAAADVDRNGLPRGVQRLLVLAEATQPPTRKVVSPMPVLERVGRSALARWTVGKQVVAA